MSLSEDPDRKPRADSLRNRELLLNTAKDAFAKDGAEVALEEIARRAGVGIGTLYRHFPNRGALLAAVYRREVEQLSEAAERLLAEKPPMEALEVWLNLMVDYMATKRVIAPALRASPGEGERAFAAGGPAIAGSMQRLTQAAIAAGQMRAEVTQEDIFRLMMGVTHGYDLPGWEHSARRLIGILVAGLRS